MIGMVPQRGRVRGQQKPLRQDAPWLQSHRGDPQEIRHAKAQGIDPQAPARGLVIAGEKGRGLRPQPLLHTLHKSLW